MRDYGPKDAALRSALVLQQPRGELRRPRLAAPLGRLLQRLEARARLAFAERAQRRDDRDLRGTRPRRSGFPVVDRLLADADEPGVLGGRHAQSPALRRQPLRGEARCGPLRSVGCGLRSRTGGAFDACGIPAKLRDLALELRDVAAVLAGRLLQRFQLGCAFLCAPDG